MYQFLCKPGRVTALLAAMLLVLPGTALKTWAVVPEPGNIYYGLAIDPWGRPYLPGSGAQVLMVRKDTTNEYVLAVSEILPFADGHTNINYILRPSLDDGLGSRYSPQAARSNEVVQIFVKVDGFRYAVTNTVGCRQLSEAVPNIGGRGTVRKVAVVANDDFDGDCMSDSWEVWEFGNTIDGLPMDDPDGDGYTNLQEFYFLSHPFDPASPGTPSTLEIVRWDAVSVTLGWQRREGRQYTLLWSDRVEGAFTAIPSERLSGAAETRIDLGSIGRVFIRLLED